MPPSAITGTPLLRAPRRAIHDGRELRHADAGHHARGADRARPDADLDGVRAGIDQGLGASARRHIAGHDLHRVRKLLDARAPASSTR